MKFLANLLSGAATEASTSNFTVLVIYDEPVCPEELI